MEEQMDDILKKMHVKPDMRLAYVDLEGILKPYLATASAPS